MKKVIFLVILIIMVTFSFISITSEADAAVRVRGYYRKNGTYVQPYYRSNPDSSRYNNWSTKGNYNPYSGKAGTRSYYSY